MQARLFTIIRRKITSNSTNVSNSTVGGGSGSSSNSSSSSGGGGAKNPYETPTYKWSGGKEGVGRKIFEKGWKHLEPRKPINLQERWHRAPIERLFHTSIMEKVRTVPIGVFHEHGWRLFFETTALDNSPTMKANEESLREFKRLSPWHDIPLGFEHTHDNAIFFNFINEIPKGDRAKVECATQEEWNPLRHDIKKEELRYFKYGDIPCNYGFIPQTWEDPTQPSQYADIKDITGDNDPIDVVEISENPMSHGEIVPIKVLNILGVIDEGEMDWKVIAIRADHPKAKEINTLKDAERILDIQLQEPIVDWFRNRKISEGKPPNKFTHNAQLQTPEMAVEIIENAHRQWYDLILGAVKSNNNLQSVTRKHLIAQGLTTNVRPPNKPRIAYPKFQNWAPHLMTRPPNIDSLYEEYDIEEESPGQQRRRGG